jgi:hypothetical protein
VSECVQDDSLEHLRSAAMLGPKQTGPNVLIMRPPGDPANLFNVPPADIRNISAGGKTATPLSGLGSGESNAVSNVNNSGADTATHAWERGGHEGQRHYAHSNASGQDGASEGVGDGAERDMEGGSSSEGRITVIPVQLSLGMARHACRSCMN